MAHNTSNREREREEKVEEAQFFSWQMLQALITAFIIILSLSRFAISIEVFFVIAIKSKQTLNNNNKCKM